jgi:aminobenzoyl-glutamate utilization protein B
MSTQGLRTRSSGYAEKSRSATSGMSIGHKGMLLAAKTLAATMVDLYEQPALLAAVRAEFEATRGDVVYESYVPDGPPPLPQDDPGN